MKKINSSIVIKQNPKAAWKEADDKLYIISPETGTIHTLNETAAFIWKEAKKPVKVSAIIDKMLTEFKASKKTLQKDILEFVQGYLNEKLLITQDASR